jgi:hypothetical protein
VGRRTLDQEKWYHRMLHTAVIKCVIIIMLLLNFVTVVTMQETSGYELQNYFEHILELITKVPALMIVT